MISMTYTCSNCVWKSGVLSAAQEHANADGHVVSIHGSITSNIPQVDATAIDAAAKQRAVDAAVLRAARDRGLLRR